MRDSQGGGGEAARGEEAGKRGGGGGEGGREGAKASRQAGERTAGENRVIACRDNIWTRRATITQTQIVDTVFSPSYNQQRMGSN